MTTSAAAGAQGSRPVALVTGGTGGIGAAACRTLARDGFDVVFTYHSNHRKANVLTSELEAAGASCHAQQVDLTEVEDVRRFVARTHEELGTIKAVVHASGPFVDQIYVSALDPAKFARHVESELIAFFNLCHVTLPDLRANRGSVTAVTSVAVRRFPNKDVLSGAPKGGIEVVVRAITREEGKFGVRANAVAPGVIDDAMAAHLIESGDFDPASLDVTLRSIPLQRFGKSQEVAELIAFLASDRASYISGQAIDVDGGYTT